VKLYRCVVAFAVLACSGGTGPGVAHSIQGIVQDSLAGKRAPAVVVQLGSFTATTDFLGAYQISSVPAGNYTLSVNTSGFEPFSKAVALTASTTQNVPLRRLAPFLKSFLGSPSSRNLTAVFLDLQGASTIAVSSSSVTFNGVNPSTGIAFTTFGGLGPASTSIVDALSVQITLNTGQLGIQRATWNVRDVGGNSRPVACIVGGSCVEQ
jgi:hypothetical protein